MKPAIVDLGSNTIRLFVYETREDGSFEPLFSEKEMAGLVNYIDHGTLTPDGINKACAVLLDFRALLDRLDLQDMHVFATASLRNIQNTDEAVQTIRRRTGITVEVLSGQEEATLGFYGALQTTRLTNGYLFDIGGGSTELVTVHNGEIADAQSLSIGCLGLFKEYVDKICPKAREMAAIRAQIQTVFTSACLPAEPTRQICGIGGTARAVLKLTNVYFKKPEYNPYIKMEELDEFVSLLTEKGRQARTLVLRRCPDRIHTIIPGALLMQAVAQRLCREEIYVSQYGVREGFLCRRLLQNTTLATPKTES